MRILVVGRPPDLKSCKLKFGDTHEYVSKDGYSLFSWEGIDIVFDFLIADFPGQIKQYKECKIPVFLNSVFTELSTLILPLSKKPNSCFGFCGMNSFFNRNALEITVSDTSDRKLLKECCEKLRTEYVIVADQVGMVTPRIVCMIINEAFCAHQENIADKNSIDLAMKLGTNYPMGPFEWAKQIGISDVVKLLNCLYAKSGENRYKSFVY